MKRKIAAALSIIMVTASYAAPFVQAADKTVTGDGTTAYVDDSVLTVVVPTTASLSFTLDPQGLVSLGESTDTSASKDDLNDYSGRILGNNALIFANKSLKPVTVTTKFKVETDADVVSPTKKTLAEAKDEDNSNKANLIFMAVPNATAINVDYSDDETEAGNEDLAKLGEYKLVDHKDVWASKGVLFGTDEVTTKSRINAADFEFTKESDGSFSYELDDSKGNSAAGFVIAGFCNPYYKDYAKLDDVKVTATYSFAASSADDKDADVATGTFAIIDADSTLNGTPSDKGVVTSVGASEATVTHKAEDIAGTLVFNGTTSTKESTFTLYHSSDYSTGRVLDQTTPVTFSVTGKDSALPSIGEWTLGSASKVEGTELYAQTLTLRDGFAGAKLLAMADESKISMTVKFGNGDVYTSDVKVVKE